MRLCARTTFTNTPVIVSSYCIDQERMVQMRSRGLIAALLLVTLSFASVTAFARTVFYVRVENGKYWLATERDQEVELFRNAVQAGEHNPITPKKDWKNRVIVVVGNMNGNGIYEAEVLGSLRKP
jgi:hypothetical protein